MLTQTHAFIHAYLSGYWAYLPAIVSFLLGFGSLLKSTDTESSGLLVFFAFVLIWVGEFLFIAV